MFPSTTARVAEHTNPGVNARIRAKTLANVADYTGKTEYEIGARLEQLTREWDTERLLEANAAGFLILTLMLGLTRSKLWLLGSTAASVFLMQHALQGWCPPIPLIRRLGVRTAAEIHDEMTALKVLRGDFRFTGEADEAVRQSRLSP